MLLSPLIIALSVIIFAQDGHNPFYKQIRVGQHGKLFGMYKFRSMIYNADKVLEKDPKLYQKYLERLSNLLCK